MTALEAREILSNLERANAALLRATDVAADRFANYCLMGQQKLFARISELLANAPDFAELPIDSRLSWYAQNTQTLERMLESSGYRKMTKKFIAEYGRFATLTEGVMKAGAFDPAFCNVPDEYIKYLMSRDGIYFNDILQSEAIHKLDSVLFEMSAGGYSRGDMLAELKGVITGEYQWGSKRGLYEWHAGTYARTSANRTAQGFMNVQAEEAGIEKFIYMGPVDSKTRAFCRLLIGRVITREEIHAMDNGMTGDVMTDRGGWNCRHQWIPASDELGKAIEQYELAA